MEARTHTSALEESAIIERVARIVFSVRGAKPDYTVLAAELESAVPFDVFGVVLLRHDRQAVRVTVCQREEGGAWKARLHQHPLTDSMLEQVLQQPELQVRDYPEGLDGAPSSSGDALSSYHQLRSTLIAPLTVENRVLGTLELGSTTLHTYADQHLQRLVDAVVRMLAAAIESVQLGGNAAIQDRQRQALKDVSRALTSKMELSTVLQQIVIGVSKALSVSSFIVLLNRHTNTLYLEAQAGVAPELLNHILQQQGSMSEKNIFWQTLKRRQPLTSQDIATDEHYPDSQLLAIELGLHSLYCYPLITGSAVYGMLVLCSTEAGGFTPLKSDILALFANQATVAIHNGMLFTSFNQRKRFQAAIEQFDRSQQERDSRTADEQLYEELKLFKEIRAEAQHTFGLNFSHMMRWMSEQLLTQNERSLQAMRSAIENEHTFDPFTTSLENEQLLPSALFLEESSLQPDVANAETQALLAQTAESALTRAAMIGELSRLITHLKQSTNWVRDPWFVVDLDGYCLYMNPAARQWCEWSLETISTDYYLQMQMFVSSVVQGQAMGPSIEEVFSRLLPRIRATDEARNYLQDFTQDSIYRQEFRCVLADEPLETATQSQAEMEGSAARKDTAASDHHYQFTRYPLYTQSGQLEAIALQVQDITEQVREEKNRSALLSAFSHDLRTPLTTIKAAVTGLLQADLVWNEEDRNEMLVDIDSEADHLTMLVNALIELSRIEMGAMELKLEWCDVTEILYTSITKLQRALGHRQLQPQLQHSLPLVYADHARLGQVFYNLVENATRHSPDGTTISLFIDILQNEREELRVRIIDQGVKIPEHECERVFTSFQSQATSYGNSLALATCKGIIEALGGHIWAEAADGGGSCFTFLLPIHPQTVVYMEEKLLAELDEDDTKSRTRS
ncbi:sensor histidine kinase [Dictyobacter kobayashii]|uniref:histidine kinase n=1 Tax=Dictyobacter kobayashii TaxID=2014872 RepID=A0A402ADW0_9CHLR|nr:GAF domain-containing protein [Dictyobacter kobayashii]GCE17232.1 hypothetical protein KDK_10320 [Dictyobacter kobayashii]